jgi:hypothetical protein
MSRDIKQRLRAPWGGSPDNCKEAADRIEALEVEVEFLRMRHWEATQDRADHRYEARMS